MNTGRSEANGFKNIHPAFVQVFRRKFVALSIIFILLILLILIDSGILTAGGFNSVNSTNNGRFAVVVKSENNLYNDRLIDGYQTVIQNAGGTVIIRKPHNASVEAQVKIINNLVDEGVDCIAIAANSYVALQESLGIAIDAGIDVISFDSAVNSNSRVLHVDQVEGSSIGSALIGAANELAGGSGQIAVLSTTNQARNQNGWIDAIRDQLERGFYPDLILTRINYGYDSYELSYEAANGLINSYPELEVIIVPTAAAMPAVSQAIIDHGLTSQIKITGLGLPSDMHSYIGAENVCPTMFLWNPIDLGKLTAHASLAMYEGELTGAIGEEVEAGEMGVYQVVADQDGGTKIVLSESPLKFDQDNIEQWKTLF